MPLRMGLSARTQPGTGPLSTGSAITSAIQRVLEPRVLAARENPPGRLQLVDSPQSLQPGVIEQVLLGRLGVAPQPFGDLDIAVQGVGDQIDRVIAAS